MQGKLFPEPVVVEVTDLTVEQHTFLDTLVNGCLADALLFESRDGSFSPAHSYARRNILFYINERPPDYHKLLIEYEGRTIGFVAMLGGWCSRNHEPASPTVLFALVAPQYRVFEREINRELKKLKLFYKKTDTK